MPYLNKIADYINTTLKQGTLSDMRFAGALYEGITTQAIKQSTSGNPPKQNPVQFSPCIFNDGKEARYISIPDSKHPLVIYHKTGIITYAKNPKGSGFGDTLADDIEAANMHLFVYGKGLRLKLTPDQLAALIHAGLPEQLTQAMITDFKMKPVTISHISTSLDPYAVYTSEFKGVEYKLEPTDILLNLNYKIESTFQRDCFNICDCPE